jgi:hypothetical protein
MPRILGTLRNSEACSVAPGEQTGPTKIIKEARHARQRAPKRIHSGVDHREFFAALLSAG